MDMYTRGNEGYLAILGDVKMPATPYGKTLARITLNELTAEEVRPLVNSDLGYIDGYFNIENCIIAVFVRMRDGLINTIPLSELVATGEENTGRLDYR
jgi:hypothetical protein